MKNKVKISTSIAGMAIGCLVFCAAFTLPTEYCIKWVDLDTHNFGEIESGKLMTCSFTFRNCSADSVTIANVRPSCGCTTPDWRTAPIPPDSTAEIGIEFSSRKSGYFYKMIKVYFKEFPQAERIYVEGTVK
jgi:hypothetical protein